jgi:metallo-beta-lactamase family protein
MPLLLKFHGALTTVTGSCHFFKVKASGNIYAVDCGATQGEDDDEQLALPRNLPRDCTPDKLSGIILTHAHGDHINHLPRWFQAGFKGQIICSQETAKLAEIALPDSRRIEAREGNNPADEASLDRTLEALRSAKYVQPGAPVILEHNVTIQAAPTSHLLGACAFRIVASAEGKTSSVLFTGDIGPVEHSDETMSLHAERIAHSQPSDYIISESTYGSRPRSKDSTSGRRRQEKVCEMLSKAFRHGNSSLVVIPAFSLQRTLDLLADVFLALQYQRSEIGLAKSVVPLICIPSGLSYNFAQAYRDFLFGEFADGQCFFNEHSQLIRTIRQAGDDEAGVFDRLIPYGKRDVVTRIDEDNDPICTEVRWGKPSFPTGCPTVVICGTGMTQGGYVTDLMDSFLDKEDATFVLCGYVPARSPGSQLRQIAPLPLNERSALAVKIPKDKQTGRPAKAVPGDAIKCGFDSVSEYYSGHADGPSIIRYILGDRLERAEQTKGIFLVHGDKGARADLSDLIRETCEKAQKSCPKVICPAPGGRWFDCELESPEAIDELAQTAEALSQMTLSPIAELEGRYGYKSPFPDELEVETCVVLNNPTSPEEALEMIHGAFDFARPELRPGSLLLKLSRPGRPHSTVYVQADKIGESLLKISAQTRAKQLEGLEDIAAVSFDWRRPLNLLGVPKELYYAGIRWCETDAEIDRLMAVCTPSVYRGKQRRQPVLILHKETLNSGELQSIERLLTPAVVVTVVDAHSVDKVNRLLGLTGEMSVTPGNSAYLPIKHSAGACQIPKADGALDIAKLTELVTADTYILNAREPQISGTGQPSPLTVPLSEMPAEQVSPQPVQAAAPSKHRAHLPIEPYLQIAIGQKVSATIEYLRVTASGSPSFALLRLDNPDVSGILHYTQMSSSFRGLKGDRIEAWVRQVSPERREVVFTQAPVRLPGDALIEAVDDRPFSPEGMVNFLMHAVTVDDILTAIEESLRVRRIDGEAPRANGSLDRETVVDAYNRVVQNRGLLNTPLIPAPEYKKVISYGEVARTLGRPLSELIASAADMIGDYDVFQIGMAVLPAGFTPTEESPFPAEHLDAFIAEFGKRAERAKIAGADLASLQPDCLSLASLAKSMGITEAELLSLMDDKGIQPKVQVVLTAQDIVRLKG